MTDLLQVAAGFGVGLMVGMTGVGGGALMTPILVLLFGVAPLAAVGTDLWFAALTKVAGSTVHHHNGSVDWPVVGLLSAGSVPASIVTLAWLHGAEPGLRASGPLLVALGAVLIFTAVAIALGPRTHVLARLLRSRAPAASKRAQPTLTILSGAAIGGLVTLTSVGAGALAAVALIAIYPFRMRPARLVGTDIAHAIPLTLVAGSGHFLMGNVNLSLLGWLLLGSVPGVITGALLGARVPERLLRGAIALVLTAVGLKLVAT